MYGIYVEHGYYTSRWEHVQVFMYNMDTTSKWEYAQVLMYRMDSTSRWEYIHTDTFVQY